MYEFVDREPPKGKAAIVLIWAPNGFPPDHIEAPSGSDDHGFVAEEGGYLVDFTHWRFKNGHKIYSVPLSDPPQPKEPAE